MSEPSDKTKEQQQREDFLKRRGAK